MRLLIHDTLVTTPYTAPLIEGWVELPANLTVDLAPDANASMVGPEDAALLPMPDAVALGPGWVLIPEIAAVSEQTGAISLRTPVRPDEVDRTVVRLLDCSSTAELLARATLRPFYGLTPSAWSRDDPAALAVVVEGGAAARPAEAGFAEDLCRAWFILTGLPVVTHLLAVPAGASDPDRALVVDLLTAARVAAAQSEHRRAWRSALADREGIPRGDTLTTIFQAQRLALEPNDQRATVALLNQAGRGTATPRLNWSEPRGD